MRLLLALSLLLSGCAIHNGWSGKDIALESTMVGAIAVDYGQTRSIIKDCTERNPIIGECGENINPKYYMIAAALTHILIANFLNDETRTMFQTTSLGVEGYVVFRNWENGHGPDFGSE